MATPVTAAVLRPRRIAFTSCEDRGRSTEIWWRMPDRRNDVVHGPWDQTNVDVPYDAKLYREYTCTDLVAKTKRIELLLRYQALAGIKMTEAPTPERPPGGGGSRSGERLALSLARRSATPRRVKSCDCSRKSRSRRRTSRAVQALTGLGGRFATRRESSARRIRTLNRPVNHNTYKLHRIHH